MPPQLGLQETNVYQCHVDRFSLPAQVRRAQALLNLFRGNLNTDGVYGSRTVDAARRFQRSMGLPVTGTIDSDDWMVW